MSTQQKRKGNYKRKWNTKSVKQFIKDNNITLLEISYKEFNNINKILDSFLCDKKVVV